MEVVDIPKGNGLIRSGSLLTLDNNLLYSFLVGDCYEKIHSQIAWSQEIVDFAYITSSKFIGTSNWYGNKIDSWSKFRTESLNKIQEGYSYVVITDITGFYDNIDINLLLSDLRSCKVDSKIVGLLSKCLNRWSFVMGKGIPQGNSSSDVLAKLYLNIVDEGLKNAGYVHMRYVDDFRIFCKDLNEAKKALMTLIALLRKRGLNIQSSKTQILTHAKATAEIDGIQPSLKDIQDRFQKAIVESIEAQYLGDDASVQDDEVLTANEDETPIGIIKEAFKVHFVDCEDSKFDKTLFHYLINRLVQDKQSFALHYVLSLLVSHPEETKYILKYSKSLDDFDIEVFNEDKVFLDNVIKFLCSDDAIYDFQNFEILRWLSSNLSHPIDSRLLKLVREFSFDRNKPYYLRSISKSILGRFGNSADLEKLEESYSETTDEIERAELLCCLTRLEKTRRNSLLGRLTLDGQVVGLATQLIKSTGN